MTARRMNTGWSSTTNIRTLLCRTLFRHDQEIQLIANCGCWHDMVGFHGAHCRSSEAIRHGRIFDIRILVLLTEELAMFKAQLEKLMVREHISSVPCVLKSDCSD